MVGSYWDRKIIFTIGGFTVFIVHTFVRSRSAVEYMVHAEYNGMNILHTMVELKSYQTLGAVFDLLVHEADENYSKFVTHIN